MDRRRFNLRRLNFWYSLTKGYQSSVDDVIVLNTTTSNIETPYVFTRYPSFCYVEPMRDYGMKFSYAWEYLELINILKSDYAHLRVSLTDVGLNHGNNYDKSNIPSASIGNYGRRDASQAGSYY